MKLTDAEIREAREAVATGEAHERMVEELKREYGSWTAERGWDLLEARLALEALLDGAGA